MAKNYTNGCCFAKTVTFVIVVVDLMSGITQRKKSMSVSKSESRKGKDAANKSMDVRAKQRLCYYVALFPFACVLPVSPHVISTVSPLRVCRREEYFEF